MRTSEGTDQVHVRTWVGATIWSTSVAEVLSPAASRLTGYVSRLSRCTTSVSPACEADVDTLRQEVRREILKYANEIAPVGHAPSAGVASERNVRDNGGIAHHCADERAQEAEMLLRGWPDLRVPTQQVC